MTDHKFDFTIYGRTNPYCQYCKQAKQLLNSRNIPFSFVSVGSDISVENLKLLVPGAKTVPQIFDGDTYVGGFSELKEYLDENYRNHGC